MTDTEAPFDIDDWAIPDHWTDSARDLFAEVLTENPNLSGADLAALEQVCELASSAEALAAVARAAGYVSTGSTGQTVVHPAQIEARLARTAAATILARLAPSRAARFTERARRAARTRHGTTT
ncbi:P27 family phage terminase small subunit [Amnibacterium sp.]|uniref:P27 family phage terminase small subunit n=1 Tax=Amnibacterium sp. TaxID=1872496 RepID=UPI003F7BDC35